MYDRKNSNINEGIIDKSVKKPEFITLYIESVENVYIMPKHSESLMNVTPDKEVLRFFCFNSIN